jgi:hypothetical protein
MHKGTIEIINKGLGFKLTKSMGFGESMISTGFIEKLSRTYSSKKTRELFHKIYMGRLYIVLEGLPRALSTLASGSFLHRL